jgi:DNA-directed RNA polymerase specialized sigma24 family protein
VAYRMLGSYTEADDAVQDAWPGLLLVTPSRCYRSKVCRPESARHPRRNQ